MTLEMKKLRTKNGQEHGLMDSCSNAVLDHGYKNLSEKNRKEMLEKKRRDLELVPCKYQNLKNQENGKWENWYGDHPGEPLRQFKLLHGFSYVLPRGLAIKINESKVPLQSGLTDIDGNMLNVEGKFDQTHQIVSDIAI